ncbi:MAG: nucleoside hydrolase [Candidatus Daviesbacteria bacterium]|nr:nucleoside hydrolase [Candidatus Daviesbacteria bacterium]
MKLNEEKKIIIDTDAGHDDALALMLLIKSKLFDIKAITTVAGNSTIDNVTRNAAFILNLLSRIDIPLFSGNPKPLKRELVQAVVHGESGLDGVDTTSVSYELTEDADEQIINLVRRYPKEITFLTIGPLSNLARAFIKDPELPSLIKEVVIMGGAINVPGNKNRVAEFNMFVDPEAAEIVFNTKVPKVMIPLDVCNQVVVLLNDFEKFRGSDLYQTIIKMMEHYIKGIEQDEGTKGALVYDVLAAYYLINSDAFEFESMDILIETKGEHTSGMTVVEKRSFKRGDSNIKVAMGIDKNKFIQDFVGIIKNP